MYRLIILLALITLAGCQNNDTYSFYKDIIEKPTINIYNGDFIADKVNANSIKSIRAYQYNDGEIRFISEDSITEGNNTLYLLAAYKYNRKGYLVQAHKWFEPYSKPHVYTFSYNDVNQLAYQTFTYSSYDTVYHIYYYNQEGDYYREIQLNNTRSEIRSYKEHEIQYDSKQINVVVNDYVDTLLAYQWRNSIRFNGNEIVRTRYRILIEDTLYNHFPDTTTYQIMNNKPYASDDGVKRYHYTFYPDGKLKSQSAGKDSLLYNSNGDMVLQKKSVERKIFQYQYDSQGNWTVRRCTIGPKTIEVIKRFIEYYDDKSDDAKPDFAAPKSILRKADSLCGVIPSYARAKALKIQSRKTAIQHGEYGKSITLKEGTTLSDFSPEYWQLISADSGYLKPFDSLVVIAAYNTPIPSGEDDDRLRCLAIFERKNNILYLREQFYHALESYNEDHTEAAYYELSLQDNKIDISYQHMRGESGISYEYDTSMKDWWLVFEWYTNRSYSNTVFQSYDYKNQLLHHEDSPFEEDSEEVGIDTLIKIKKQIPRLPMDVNRSRHSNDTIRIKGYGTIYF